MPALVLDDGAVLDESVAICRYLEETHPQPPLMGIGALGKARGGGAPAAHGIRRPGRAAADAFRNAFPHFSSRGLPGTAETVDAIPALVERGKASVLRFYRRLNIDLATSAFIAGDDFTIADITALCTLDFAVAAARVAIPDDCANLKRWYAHRLRTPQRTGLKVNRGAGFDLPGAALAVRCEAVLSRTVAWRPAVWRLGREPARVPTWVRRRRGRPRRLRTWGRERLIAIPCAERIALVFVVAATRLSRHIA